MIGPMEEPDSDRDETGLGEDDLRRIEAAKAELANIYRLRGEIVSRVNEFEAYADTAVAGYFGIVPANPLSDQFRMWVLARTSFSAKLEIIGEIVREVGIEEQAKPLLGRLTRANDTRNRIAHSHMSLDISPGQSEATWEALLRHRSVSYSRRSKSVPLVTAHELQRDCNSIAALEAHLLFLMLAIITSRTGQRPASLILEESYDLNPGARETRPM
jgi:hypothetical protein